MDEYSNDTERHGLEPLEDEIELIDLLWVAWKRRYLIIVGTVTFAAVAGILSGFLPKIYESSMLIDSGVAKGNLNGKPSYLVEPRDLKKLIESDVFNHKVTTMVQQKHDSKLPIDMSFSAQVRGGTNVMEVLNHTEIPDLARDTLSLLHEVLQQKYSQQLEYFQELYRGQELSLTDEIEGLKHDLELKMDLMASLPAKRKIQRAEYSQRVVALDREKSMRLETIERLRERASDIQEQVGRVHQEVEVLTGQRQEILKRAHQDVNLLEAVLFGIAVQLMSMDSDGLKSELMLVNNGIQEELMEISRIEDEVAEAKAQAMKHTDSMDFRKTALRGGIHDLKTDIASREDDLLRLRTEKAEMHNIGLLEIPSTKRPVARKIWMHVLLGGAIGVFTMLFLAFLMEYIQRNKKKLR